MSKKLKQACLPFKSLGSKSDTTKLSLDARAQKRKHSEEQCKIESKVAKPDVVVVLSDDDDCMDHESLNGNKNNQSETASPTVQTVQNELPLEATDTDNNEMDKNDVSSTAVSEDEVTILEEDPELSPSSGVDSEEQSPSSSPKNKETTLPNDSEGNVSKDDIADVSISPNSGNTSVMSTPSTSKKRKSLKMVGTSEELQKKMEEKQKRQREREEANMKKEQAKQEKLKQKEERLKQRQQQHEAKLEEKRKKDEERKVKEESKRQRDEEKRKKDEDKRKKDEEKRNREEEKRKAEEELTKKKEKEKQAFVSFFVKRDAGSSNIENAQPETRQYFLPFPVKENMKIAPVCRVSSEKLTALKPALDNLLTSQSTPRSYLDELKNKSILPGKCDKTWTDNDPDVEIVNSDGKPANTYKAKLLQFCENTRPPYWGTWLKQSRVINPRNPLKKDNDFFDYDVDSDDEWEEEEAGESLANTDDEKESEDDYEVDNDVFVPHGYLSDEEAQNEDEMTDSPDAMKIKLRLLEQEFQKELKNQCKKLNPRVFGCFWADDDRPGIDELKKVLSEYSAVPLVTVPIEIKDSSARVTDDGNEVTPSTSKSDMVFGGKGVVPDEAMPYLIKMLHGNTNGKDRLLPEFLNFWNKPKQMLESTPKRSKISKRQLKITVQQIATWGKFPDPGPLFGKCCYYVKEEIRSKYDLGQLEVPNTWTYVTSPAKKQKTQVNAQTTKITSLLGLSVEKVVTEAPEAESVPAVANSNGNCEMAA